MIFSVCLTCCHSRRGVMGNCHCSVDGKLHQVMDVCGSFAALGAFQDVKFHSCSVSTTATNSPSGEFLHKKEANGYGF